MNRCPLLFFYYSRSLSPSVSLSVSFSGWFLFHIKTFHNQPSYWLISILIIANEFKCPEWNTILLCKLLLNKQGTSGALLTNYYSELFNTYISWMPLCWMLGVPVVCFDLQWPLRNWGIEEWRNDKRSK